MNIINVDSNEIMKKQNIILSEFCMRRCIILSDLISLYLIHFHFVYFPLLTNLPKANQPAFSACKNCLLTIKHFVKT